jgi:LPXTG-motif cell wall-anchored protein
VTRRSLIGRAVVAAGLAALFLPVTAPSGAASTGGSEFTKPVKLTGAGGGEPSIANDRHGNVYVVGPQGIPAGVNDEPGVAVWVSHNNGTSFPKAAHAGSFLGGGDSDVEVDGKTVYLADLEAAASAVCKSTDHGKTFNSIGPAPDPGKCGGVVVGQTGPSDDRQWLTADHHGRLYITYHEFVSAQPLIFRSDDGGDDLFTAGPCGPLVTDPTIESNVPTDVTGGTLVSKPVTDSAGNLYVMFTTTTQAENAAAFAAGKASGTFSQIYLAVSKDHCGSFKDYTVFDGSKLGTNTVQFGNIFNALTIDGGDNLYALGAGYIGKKSFATTSNVYLFSSHDHGKKWTSPTLVGSRKSAHSLPAAVGGPKSGQLAIGYFRTTNGKIDPNDTAAKWTYGTAETKNATAKHPKFRYADVRPGFTYHKGEICNAGILCGNVPNGPSDRSLLDFTSATVDRHGCPLFTFAGNPAGVSKGTFNYVTRQTSHCFAVPASQNHPPAKHHRHHHHHNGGGQGPSGPSPGSPAPRSSSGSLASTGISPWLAVAGLLLLAAAALLVRRIRRS